MPTITTKDGTEIFYKDWGPRDARAVVFHHGWPLSGDDAPIAGLRPSGRQPRAEQPLLHPSSSPGVLSV